MKTQEISIENLIKTNKELTAENEQLRQQIQWLMEQFRLSKHKQFGASSEQTDFNQLNLFNEEEQTAVPIEEAAFCAAGEKLERTDDLDSLAKAVLKLPAIYKDALKLKYVQEFSNAEIAGMLGISETAVRKRLDRARRMLEEILGREGFSNDD
jgi:RNA polymerase sigma factor (sigma-70 family)